MRRSKSLAATGTVVLVGVVAALVLTAPWPSGSGSREKSHPGGAPTPLAVASKLLGGKARFVNCRQQGRERTCEAVGPTGERVICSIFEGEGPDDIEFSCFDRYVREER